MDESEHDRVGCSVPECNGDATHWIHAPKWLTIRTGGTFYVCEDHHNNGEGSMIEDEDGMFSTLNPNGVLEYYEVGVYSCHEDCPVCSSN